MISLSHVSVLKRVSMTHTKSTIEVFDDKVYS